jgi:hypothetical protein
MSFTINLVPSVDLTIVKLSIRKEETVYDVDDHFPTISYIIDIQTQVNEFSEPVNSTLRFGSFFSMDEHVRHVVVGHDCMLSVAINEGDEPVITKLSGDDVVDDVSDEIRRYGVAKHWIWDEDGYTDCDD